LNFLNPFQNRPWKFNRKEGSDQLKTSSQSPFIKGGIIDSDVNIISKKVNEKKALTISSGYEFFLDKSGFFI
jgi:hypothetical protein